MSLPQREGRPALDLSPEATPDTASWDDDYGNLPYNPLNGPVPQRKGKPALNGWMEVAVDTNIVAGTTSDKSGTEQK